jgi:hypothetical protein
MTPEDFKNFAQGFQALFVAFAAIVGGIWVLLRFGITRERARAQLDLERLRVETEGLKGVSCELAVHHEEHEGKFFVYADATLMNHGSSALVYRCDDGPFHINRVTIRNNDTWFDEVARLNIEEATSNPDMQSTFRVSVALLPNTPVRMSFHYVLDEAGSYMFSLVLERDKFDEGKLARDKQELQKRWEIYKQHKDHPLYRENPKAELVFDKHYFVGRKTELAKQSHGSIA